MKNSLKKTLFKVLLLFAAVTFTLGFIAAGNGIKKVGAQGVGEVISLENGAYVNVSSSENAGLRFKAFSDKTIIDNIRQAGATVDFGMLIVPTDMVKDAATGGKAFTVDDLLTYEPLTGYDFYKIAGNVKTEETQYVFYMTLPRITENNYSTEFSARAFIRISGVDALPEVEGIDLTAISVSGAEGFYVYCEYNEENNSRTVYEVSYSAYTDRSKSQTGDYANAVGDGSFSKLSTSELEIAGNFADGVLELETRDEKVVIASNGEYYTSPFTLLASEDGKSYIIGDKGNIPASVIYNGVRKTKSEYNFTDGSFKFGTLESNDASFNEDGSVKVVAGVLGPNSDSTNKYGMNENGYVAFKGDYGVNTYVETTFTASIEKNGGADTDYGHDNIPQVLLFADSIDGFKHNGKGILLTSGINYYNAALDSNYTNKFSVIGPDRVTDINGYRYPSVYTTEFPLLTQDGLRADSNNLLSGGETTVKTYKYIVGTFYAENGHLIVDVSLLVQDGENWIAVKNANHKAYSDIYLDTGLTQTDVAAMGTNIVLMAENKNAVWQGSTTFTYSAPYEKTPEANKFAVTKSAGATVGKDGTLTIANKAALGTTATSAALWAEYWNYFAFTGNYGVGNYLDIVFTGYQMPQFIFFAKEGTVSTGYASVSSYNTGVSTGKETNYSRQGVAVLNGLYNSGNYIQVFGPNRMYMTGGVNDQYGGNGGLIKIDASDPTSEYYELSRTGQFANKDKEYFMTIGTFIGTDGKVWLDITLKDNATLTEICRLSQSLGLTEAEVGVEGDVILLPPLGVHDIDGDGTDDITDGTTSMVIKSFTAPYKKTA